MKISNFKFLSSAALLVVFIFGCSKNSNTNQNSQTSVNENSAVSQKTGTASPCANKYYPVRDGLVKNYKNTLGGDTRQKIEYADGAAEFTEVMTLKDINVKHVWNCTDEGLIASNYGSSADMKSTKIEPKHVSGVTLPNDADLQIGKTWTTVYQGTGTSPLGAVEETVTLNNKVVALDEEVKTPAGNYKALKIESDVSADMKFDGKKTPVPNFKITTWYAPDIGIVKSGGTIMGISNTMEYAGGN